MISTASGYDPTLTEQILTNGLGTGSQRFFFINSHRNRIRQNGIIKSIKIYIGQKPDYVVDFFFSVWRKRVDGKFDKIFQEEIWGKIKQNKLNMINIAGVCIVQQGDFVCVGGHRTPSTINTAFMVSKDFTYDYSAVYTDDDITLVDVYDFDSVSITQRKTYVIPVQTYVDSPKIIFIGESIVTGHPLNYSFIEKSQITDIASSMPYKVATKYNFTYQNMGIGGQKIEEISARFDNDVIALKPIYAVISGGTANVKNETTPNKSNFLAKWKEMLSKCSTHNIIPVVCLIPPRSDLTTTQETIRKDWNASLKLVAEQYSNIVIVDSDTYLGVPLNPSYTVDNVHFNEAGNTAFAKAITDQLDLFLTP